MLLTVSFFPLADGKTADELVAFEKRIINRYSDFMSEIGWHYFGIHAVSGLPPHDIGEIYLINAHSRAEALARDAAHEAPEVMPADIPGIYAECRAFMGPAERRVNLWLRPVAVTPEPLEAAHSLLLTLGVRAQAETDASDRAETITLGDRNEFLADYRWQCAATYEVEGPAEGLSQPYTHADLYSSAAASPAEAQGAWQAATNTSRWKVITAASVYQDIAEPALFWLTPLALAPMARRPVRFE